MENDIGNEVMDPQRIFVPSEPARRASLISLSFLAHVAALVLILIFWRTASVQIVPEKFQMAQRISGAAPLAFLPAEAKAAQTHGILHAPRKARAPGSAGEGDATAVLREHAKRATAALMMNLRFRLTYGFSAGPKYQLPFQMAGEIPPILPADLPPRFEQYVTVEVTIDTDGRVADARVVGGLVERPIQQKLLSAIRQFKYTPATRDGIPIPSQLDIVVHIPT